MRTFGRLWLVIPFVFAAAVSTAHADDIVVGSLISFEKGNGHAGGGDFIATVAGTGEQFLTFCLQVERPLDFGPQYFVGGITDYAYWEDDNRGGDTITGRDPISSQTAWLYTQFRNGTLNGYDGSSKSNDALQEAFWQLEEEIDHVETGQVFTSLGQHFIALANQAVANGWSGIGDVRVLNLVAWDGTDIQDQLTLVDSPEPSTVALLACGLFGLAVTRRRWLPATARLR